MNDYVIDRSRFGNKDEFYVHLGNVLRNLADDGYVCTFRYDDCGIYAIEYDYADPSLGCRQPYWLLPEEFESIDFVNNKLT